MKYSSLQSDIVSVDKDLSVTFEFAVMNYSRLVFFLLDIVYFFQSLLNLALEFIVINYPLEVVLLPFYFSEIFSSYTFVLMKLMFILSIPDPVCIIFSILFSEVLFEHQLRMPKFDNF